jgi:iron(III) transport system permease protein
MRDPSRWAAAAAAALLAVAVGAPIAALIGAFEPSAASAVLAPANLRALGNTLAVALGVLAMALAIGVPGGLLLGRADLPNREAWRTLATLPYLVPPYVSAIGWLALLNPTSGWLRIPGVDPYGLGGMIWIMGLEHAPLVLLATSDAARRLDPALEEAARVAGAGPLAVIARVTLPLAAPAIAESAGFVLASSAAAFGVPYLLASGSSSPRHVLTTRIAQALDLDPAHGRPVAVALAALLLAVGLGLPALVRAWAPRARTVGGKAARPPDVHLGGCRWPALGAVAGFVLVAGALPLGTLAILSLMRSVGAGFDADNFSLATWTTVLGRAGTRAALGRSLGIAAGAATVAAILGVAVALLQERTALRGRHWLGALARLPYAIPGTVLALGMLLAWSQEIRLVFADRVTFALALADTSWLVGLAWTAKYLAIPVGSATAALGSLDRSLDEAARIGGATAAGALRYVTLPLLRRDLLSAWLMVFLPAFSEVTLAVLLCGPDSRVLGVELFNALTYGDPPAAAVLAVVTTAVVLAGNLALRQLTPGRTEWRA